MTTTAVAIIDGGLAGLNAARRLQEAGIDFLLLEARDRPGGRILSVNADGRPDADGFDLGPSWFWPERQPAVATLVRKLGLKSFPQNAAGDVVFERMSREAPHRLSGLRDDQQSQRLVGGSAAMVEALMKRLPPERLRFGVRVTSMSLTPTGVELVLDQDEAGGRTISAARVIAALPPRLLAANVQLSPVPNAAILTLWRATPTWMAPHAKFFALYDRPFWREAGFSGTAQSLVGPMAEIHDATTRSGRAALFGFVGVGAGQRQAMGEAALTAACLQQLARIFGPEAAHPRATLFKDWATDPLTAAPEDSVPTPHTAGVARDSISGPWQERFLMAGSETSDVEAGFLSGAIEASDRAVQAALDRIAAEQTE